MTDQYFLQLNLYDASEPYTFQGRDKSLPTGHSNITLVTKAGSSVTSKYTFGVNVYAGDFKTWTDADSELQDGGVGYDGGWDPDDGRGISASVPISKEKNIMNFWQIWKRLQGLTMTE
ncbi:MAG: hypothetical protein JJ866_10085 [Roseibium sp.]|uniref:hypothetical protein n=1 Tax=Roseibium sp. TaxID=1936156 RepID=UPI001B0A59A4|nr:hypothetical protein [Roseibium sp.]MBO6892276.1 hypothetical protein [Roseibium sp.]MBO6930860.1 hypothetical protein [Roseibium sp.]